MTELTKNEAIGLTVDVVTAFIGHNTVSAHDFPALVSSVYEALATLGREPPQPEIGAAGFRAASSQIRKSITPDVLISFEDGLPYRTLKRHLRSQGLTPAEYRAKWGLPIDYPMTAATYSAARSSMAKALGLGLSNRGRKRSKLGA